MIALHWPDICFTLVLLFFLIYSILDGFDLGIGISLLRRTGGEDAGRLTGLIAPYWDGNEVWLVMAAGFLFAAFPAAFATLVSAFYLPFMAVVAAYILRAAALEFSYQEPERAPFWRMLFSFGSLVAAFGGLAAVGAVLRGFDMQAPGLPSPGLGAILCPQPLILGAAGTALVLWHGLAYAHRRLKTEKSLQSLRSAWRYAAAAGIVSIGLFISLPERNMSDGVVMAGALLFAAGLVLGRVLDNNPGRPFLCSSVMVAGVWLVIGGRLYPDILPALQAGQGLSIAAAAAPASTLRFIAVLSIAFLPVILLYTWAVYRIFSRGKPAAHKQTTEAS